MEELDIYEKRNHTKLINEQIRKWEVLSEKQWCPTISTVTRTLTLVIIGLLLWSIFYFEFKDGVVPGSQVFSLIILFISAYVAGCAIELIRLPPLLGMLLMGILLRNIGFVHLKDAYQQLASILREIALVVILTRAGLGLDAGSLKKLGGLVARLAIIPSITECLFTTLLTHYLLDLPWLWGVLLGSILAAVSPAVVIPCLFALQEQGYGTNNGIPTLIIAAASFDDVLAISAFGVVLSLIFSTGNLVMQIIQGPLGVIIGIVFGILWGLLLWVLPHKQDSFVGILRTLVTALGGIFAIFGSQEVNFDGAGPLACIVLAFVACIGWHKQGWTYENNPVRLNFAVIWTFFQPILFGLIGSEVDISVLDGAVVGNSIACLLIALLARIIISILIAFGSGFNWKEKIFIAWAWFPKATVQAALGPVALDIARKTGDEDAIKYASKVLITAVLAILVTAPIGAILITILGPILLTKSEKPSSGENENVLQVNDRRSEEQA